jgi:hypothetical protein
MKKFIVIILSILPIFFISINQVNSLSIADFSPTLDKAVAKMKTTEKKVKFLKTFSDSLVDPSFTEDKNAKFFADLREYSLNMLKVFEYELEEEQRKSGSKTTSSKNTTSTTKSSTINLPHLSDNFSNINEQQVRDAILSWHNEERNNI